MRLKNIYLLTILALVSCGQKPSSPINGDFNIVDDSSIIVGDLNWSDISDLSTNHPGRVSSWPIADLRVTYVSSEGVNIGRTVIGRCTGSMISKDLLITNAHCFPQINTGTSRQELVPENFIEINAHFTFLKGNTSRDISNQHTCRQLLSYSEASSLDFAIVRCEESSTEGFPGEQYGTVELSRNRPAVNDEIYVIHQNCDSHLNPGCLPTKKYSPGKMVTGHQTTEGFLHYDADTLGGSSGSSVFDAQTNQMVGLHHAGLGSTATSQGRGLYNEAVPIDSILGFVERFYPELYIEISTAQGGRIPGEVPSLPGDTGGDTSPTPVTPAPQIIDDGDSAVNFARPLTEGNAFAGEISSVEDHDYFKFTVEKDGEYEIRLQVNDQADLDMHLFNTDDQRLASANQINSTPGHQEVISIELGQGESYYFFIHGYSAGKYSVSYNLLDGTSRDPASPVEPTPTPVDPAPAPVDPTPTPVQPIPTPVQPIPTPTPPVADDGDGAVNLARALSEGSSFAGEISSVEDHDYYKFTTQRSGNYEIRLQVNDEADLDMHLYNSANQRLASANQINSTRGHQEVISIELGQGESYYFFIHGYSAGRYSISYHLLDGANTDPVSPVEPIPTPVDPTPAPPVFNGDGNDSAATATGLIYKDYKDADLSSSSDLDYYEFVAESSKRYEIKMRAEEKGLAVYVYDDSLRLLDSSDKRSTSIKVKVNVEKGKKYFVLVRSADGTSGSYEIRYKRSGWF